jgi:hypothetical protein
VRFAKERLSRWMVSVNGEVLGSAYAEARGLRSASVVRQTLSRSNEVLPGAVRRGPRLPFEGVWRRPQRVTAASNSSVIATSKLLDFGSPKYKGLIPEATRTDSGYRDYGEEDVERLAFIHYAQSSKG